jgi:hypothetical protein
MENSLIADIFDEIANAEVEADFDERRARAHPFQSSLSSVMESFSSEFAAASGRSTFTSSETDGPWKVNV